MSSLDLYGRHFNLITGRLGRPWRTLAERMARHYGLPLQIHIDQEADSAEHWAQSHGVTVEGAVLVRPDGFVAWRSAVRTEEPARDLDTVITHILGLRPQS